MGRGGVRLLPGFLHTVVHAQSVTFFQGGKKEVAYIAVSSRSCELSAGLWCVTMLLLLLVKDDPTSPVLLPLRKNSFFSSASFRSWLGSLTIVPNFGATFFASATCADISTSPALQPNP
jgi:hypothetical protein